jgi:lipopolysaccharide biosynthesis protein
VADPRILRFLAFYLPQYHPIPENDDWWGRGFTEWTNVTRARPLFRGHYQPHLPADLGFYDLRVPEVRAAQAELAAAHGIDGFCYYHYWFHGRRLLELPFGEVLRSGEPDFPFALCWANENWTRVWNGGASQVLMPQQHSLDDDLRHIRWLAEAFADPRYVRVDGRPLFLVYRPGLLPDPQRTAEVWREEAGRLGVGEPYLCAVTFSKAFTEGRREPAALGFDAAVQFAPDFRNLGPKARGSVLRRGLRKFLHPSSSFRRHAVFDYREMVTQALCSPEPGYKRYPTVSPGFDNTARRRDVGALVILNSSPERYEQWLRAVIDRFEPFSPEENLVFVNAWNEWAEGNHLEPCQKWGRAYLEAHARASERVGPTAPAIAD